MKLTDFLQITKPFNRSKGDNWRVELGDLAQYGKTQEETMVATMNQAVEALTGDYEPRIIWNSARTEYCIIYRTPWQGWCYAIREADKRVQDGGWCAGFLSREECVTYAAKHLASNEE